MQRQSTMGGVWKWVLGIDIAKAKFDVALLFPDGRFKNKVFANDASGFSQLSAWLVKQGVNDGVHACMEATGIYWEALAEYLADAGHRVSVVNPARIKAFGTSLGVRTKNDPVDARLIANYCARQNPALWQAPPTQLRALRALVLRRQALGVMRTQETNRLKVAHEAVQPGIQAHISGLEQQIEDIEQKSRELINRDPDLRRQFKLLDTVPGLGEKTISLLLSYYSEHQRFQKANEASAFAGLNPQQRQSGSSVKGKTHLSKIGHSAVRKALYMPAVVAMTKTKWGKAFAARLRAAGKIPMVIIGALMRKLVHIAYGVLKSGKPFDPTLHGLTQKIA